MRLRRTFRHSAPVLRLLDQAATGKGASNATELDEITLWQAKPSADAARIAVTRALAQIAQVMADLRLGEA